MLAVERRQFLRKGRLANCAHEALETGRLATTSSWPALERAAALPHRERYLRLVHRLGELQLAAYEQWLDEVRTVLSGS